MVKQISLDAWQIQQLSDLLKKGSDIVAQTNRPIILYRQTLDEEDESYEEIVCSLTNGYVIEQMVTSGGILVPSFHQQFVFRIEEYPQELLRKSKDRFLEMIDFLQEQLK
ncbi:hypothetical protein NMSP_0500 [Candidatus Nitrosomarinus catalina]|jgi:hypothetical protein|uniref:Uncharacterized protein n=1 Tax=Candidatus Nitrosomarinus catalinensis TaxID=1898749 RepID=A0A2Z2HJ14_9ARCH|nr:hypothetical protein [Candidatus Nitrosomarinus catalina]ARS64121.1 hypothetical protein NMSP_0500 [Candidatus Nitrosomarinus catalina]